MPDLPLFKKTQYEFAAHIRDPQLNPKPADVEARRMNIYTDLFLIMLKILYQILIQY